MAWGVTTPIDMAWKDGLCWLRPRGRESFFFAPLGDWGSVRWSTVLREHFTKGDVMLNVPNKLVEFIVTDYQSEGSEIHFNVTDSRNDWEYLYNISDLVSLKGNKYTRIRNHINKFFSGYSWEYLPVSPQHFSDILHIQDKWAEEHTVSATDSLTLAAENRAVRKILEHWDEFPLSGGLLKANGEIIGYTIAEELDQTTIDTRFEKTVAGYSGSYQALQYLFLKEQSAKYTIVNREEDLGIPGLRKAKMSYRPSDFIKKSRIEFI